MKIISVNNITLDAPIEVYDIETDHESHNFLLSVGVFVHNCCSGCHDSILAEGSNTVIINGLECGRIGDPVACGSSVMQGSSNTFAGG